MNVSLRYVSCSCVMTSLCVCGLRDWQVTDHTVRQLVVNCRCLTSLSLANCTLITDNALLDVTTHATHLTYVSLSVCLCRCLCGLSVNMLQVMSDVWMSSIVSVTLLFCTNIYSCCSHCSLSLSFSLSLSVCVCVCVRVKHYTKQLNNSTAFESSPLLLQTQNIW